MLNPSNATKMTQTEFVYYAILTLLARLIRRGYTLEHAAALLEGGRWPGVE